MTNPKDDTLAIASLVQAMALATRGVIDWAYGLEPRYSDDERGIRVVLYMEEVQKHLEECRDAIAAPTEQAEEPIVLCGEAITAIFLTVDACAALAALQAPKIAGQHGACVRMSKTKAIAMFSEHILGSMEQSNWDAYDNHAVKAAIMAWTRFTIELNAQGVISDSQHHRWKVPHVCQQWGGQADG